MLEHLISRAFGAFASTKFPAPIQKTINNAYSSMFDIDFSEFAPPSSYDSLLALFTRSLLIPRPLENGFISPSDGVILYSGYAQGQKALSVKGHSYDINELLADTLAGGELGAGFDYAGIYLSPRDYHHFHAPCNFKLEAISYQSGALYSVAPSWLKRIENLYAKNERVIMRCALANNKIFWLVFVGALNVGKMVIERENRVKTNANLGNAIYTYDNEFYKKGERIGRFELGSTIVIIAQKGALNFNTQSEQKIKFSQKIAEII